LKSVQVISMFAARSLIVFGIILITCLGPGARFSGAQQQVTIESVFPAQMPRGQSTVLHVAFPGAALVVQAAEISPSSGVTVAGIKRALDSQNVAWWEVTVDVAKDAAPGNRSLVLVMPMGRTLPATVTVPTHVPSIADLRIVSAQSNRPTIELQFAAIDESADLGDSPYVWFTIGCGESVVGVVKGKVTARDTRNLVVHSTVPNPRAQAGTGAAVKCDLRVRVTDSNGIESNTLNTTVDFKN
jgi:hypothetical protein